MYCRVGRVLDTNGNGDDHDRCHDANETDPGYNTDFVQGLNRRWYPGPTSHGTASGTMGQGNTFCFSLAYMGLMTGSQFRISQRLTARERC
jgi:hypothetical protein